MPIYEYECAGCQQQVELLIRGSETPECPQCGSAELHKQFSVPAAHSGGFSLPLCGPMPAPGGGG